MKGNSLRELLKKNKPTLGTHVIIPWPGIIEIIGKLGIFDYVEYSSEYSPFTLSLFDDLSRAVELFPEMSSMIKVEEQAKGFVATRAIDAGIQNVLFTDCRSPEDVKECIRLVRAETPEDKGVHGCSLRRNTYNLSEIGTEDWVKSMRDVVIAVMIEKKSAMDRLEEILSIKGVDMVQFGPGDYAITIGRPGQGGSSEIKATQEKMIKMALERGIAPRVEIATWDQAKPFIDMGVRHFCIGWDMDMIKQYCLFHGTKMKELLNST